MKSPSRGSLENVSPWPRKVTHPCRKDTVLWNRKPMDVTTRVQRRQAVSEAGQALNQRVLVGSAERFDDTIPRGELAGVIDGRPRAAEVESPRKRWMVEPAQD